MTPVGAIGLREVSLSRVTSRGLPGAYTWWWYAGVSDCVGLLPSLPRTVNLVSDYVAFREFMIGIVIVEQDWL